MGVGAPALGWMTVLRDSHPGKSSRGWGGGGRPGFPSPWQPNQTNNTAGRALGAGWRPVQPCFPMACPGNWRPGEGELRALLLLLPWGGGGGRGCRKLWQSLSLLPGSPQGNRHPWHSRHHTTGASPTPAPKPRGCWFLTLPALSARQSPLRCPSSLSCSPAPGPGTSCPPIPAPAATPGTAIPQPLQPRAAPLVPAVKTQALAPDGNGPAVG